MTKSSSLHIAVSASSFSKNPVLREEVSAQFPKVRFNENTLNSDALIQFIGDAEAAIVGREAITDTVLQRCPNLKIISKYGVGLDNVDMAACEKYGVKIGWTGGVNRLCVAEMTLAFMIALSRNLYSTSVQLKGGTWNKNGGRQLSEKTIGIIGVGHIGKELIRLLAPFKCRILANDIIQQDEYYQRVSATPVSKAELYAESDIISIHTPLNDDTRGLIDKESLKAMKPNAVLINTARGGIVNENDLKAALIKQEISGAALDVFEEEPPVDSELLSLPQLFCTPHIGGNAQEAVLAMGRSAIGHLKDWHENTIHH